jgi:hypothetical protein
MSEPNDLKYLEDFILRNPDLDKLENLLEEFNIFETLKITQAEIRHSNVIAWLLNPTENHGLSNYFLKQLFKFLVSTNSNYFENLAVSIFDFELFNYGNVEIRREWNNLDILVIITEDSKKVVVAFENKIKTTEHSDQLARYRKIIEKEFPNSINLFVYLTPDNIIPSDEAWIPFNYDSVTDIIGDILQHRKDSLSSKVALFLSQYNTILRRYVVGQSEVEKIAVEIYKKHKEALDIIFQYKPDTYLILSEFLQKNLKENENIIIETAGKAVIRFTTKQLDSLIEKVGEGWTKSKRIFLFEIYLHDNQANLRLYIGPGDNDYRESLRQFLFKQKDFFKLIDRKFGTKYHAVYQRRILTKRDFEEKDDDELKESASRKLSEFFEKDLPKIENYFVDNWQKEKNS